MEASPAMEMVTSRETGILLLAEEGPETEISSATEARRPGARRVTATREQSGARRLLLTISCRPSSPKDI
jgi:hypothetical protein